MAGVNAKLVYCYGQKGSSDGSFAGNYAKGKTAALAAHL